MTAQRAVKIPSLGESFDVAIFHLILCVLIHLASAAEIVRPPNDTTVFLDESAVFECEFIGDSSFWRVNGTSFNRLELELRNDLMIPGQQNTEEGNILIQLIIPGRAKYNGTRVQCVVSGSQEESGNVTLNVQGLLSVVGDHEISSDGTSITISWTAPYSLDVTGVDPDIWYSVFIYNVTDDEPTLISCTDCINITDTHYSFTPDSPSPCHQYIFTVIPVNGAGEGESSRNISLDGPDINVTQIDLRALNTTAFRVIYQVMGEVDRICDYTLDAVVGVDDVQLLSDDNNAPLQSGGNVIYTLTANQYVYFPSFEISTDAGPQSVLLPNFTTFDVQVFTASGEDSWITVTGEFINDTLATGCFIVIQSNSSTADIYRALLRQDSEQTVSGNISVPPSVYTVYAYDLEENALPYPLPAISSGTPITINTPHDSIPESESSMYLNNATVSQNGLQVFITCQFSNVYSESSCVLVYREYGNRTLTVIEYPHSTEFPVNVTVDNPERYTFVIFGKNGDIIDEEPAIAVKLPTVATVTPPTTVTPTPTTPDDKKKNKQAFVLGVVVGVMVALIALIIAAIVVVVIVMRMKKKKSVHPDPLTATSITSNTSSNRPDDDDTKESIDVKETTNYAYVKSSTAHNGEYEMEKRGEAVDIEGEKNGLSAERTTTESSRTDSEIYSDIQKETSFKQSSADSGALVTVDDDRKKTEASVDIQGENTGPSVEASTPWIDRWKETHYTDVIIERGASPQQPVNQRVKYEDIDHKTTQQQELADRIKNENAYEKESNKKTEPQKKSVIVPTVEAVMNLLYDVRGRWKEIAEGLGFDDDVIDEIFTNNEMDEACLQNCIEMWVQRLGPTWEKLSHVLANMGENQLAHKACLSAGMSNESTESDGGINQVLPGQNPDNNQ